MDHVSFQPPHIWSQGMIPMDYPHPPFTSPPATPMTPMTPALNHHHFPAAAYDVPPPHLYTSAPPPPPPPPPFPSPPDYRLFALCQHLKTYSKVSDSETKRWWEDFMTEFFHDNSTLVVETDLGEGIRKYHLNRQWIPLYFQSLMDNGVTSVHLDLGQCISTYHQSLQELECHNATMETSHTSPHPTKVCINGALVVDFSLEDKPRIITWYFNINDHTEYIPRAMAKPGNESGGGGGVQDSITNRGILPSTQKLLLEVGRLENNGYHEATMRNITCSSADGMHRQHWQDMAIINVQSGLEVINGVPLQPEALPPGPGAMILSPGGGIAHSMALMPNSPCLHPNTVGGGGGGGAGGSSSSSSIKSKSGRSSTHSNGGNRKRSSPIPNSGTGGSAAKKTHQFMLVAAEAVPLKDADDLPFVPEERRIMRIDNDHHRRHRTTSPQTPTSASKSSPPSNSNTISNGGSVSSNSGSSVSNSSNHVNGVSMSKLCHISNEPGRGLSVDSSMDLGANPNKVMYDSPLQPWTSDGLVAMNQGTPLTTTTR